MMQTFCGHCVTLRKTKYHKKQNKRLPLPQLFAIYRVLMGSTTNVGSLYVFERA
jgi:hypothetical protein